MQFVNPLFLLGLLAISIPVIIHLFNFRKFRKVYFTNVKFIEELRQQTQKHSQLKHLLVLLMRILAIVSLVLAFAQPYIPLNKNANKKESQNTVSIFIDNSFSMEAASSDGTLLDLARQKAGEITAAYKSSDRFQLLTGDFEGKHQRFVSREEFVEMLDEVEISPVTRPLSEVVKRQSDLFSEQAKTNHTAFLVSDFQKGITDFGNISPDSSVQVVAIPLEASGRNNLYIDTIWFDSPVFQVSQVLNLNVRIKNASENDFEKIPVKLLINNQQKAIASFDVKSGEETDIRMPFTASEVGIQSGKLEITDFPITYDDSFYFTFEVKSEIPVLAIYDRNENVYLNSLFGKDSAFVYTTAPDNKLDYSAFSTNSLIILDGLKNISSGLGQEIRRFADGGGSIMVFPANEIDLDSYTEFFGLMAVNGFTIADTFQTRISSINLQSTVYDDVFESMPENIDLPAVFRHYPIRRQANSMMEELLTLQNGDVFLGAEPTGKGTFYLCAAPLDQQWTNFPKHAIFVPSLYKIALLSNPGSQLYYTAGDNEDIIIKKTTLNGDQIFKIRSLDGNFEIIPEHRAIASQISIFTRNKVKKAGNYEIVYEGRRIAGVSFNYNRAESDMVNLSKTQIEKMIQDFRLDNFSVISPTSRSLSEVITEIDKGFRLWKIFIVLALVFLLGELLLLRFWNKS
jgi:hypothetical protein